MFAVSRGRGGLDLKLGRYSRQAGACSCHGIGSEGAISASIRLLPRRSASGGQTAPLSSRRVAAGDQQVREPQQQRDALPVLRHAPVAHLGVAEVPLHVQEGMLHLRPHRTPCASRPPLRRRPRPAAGAAPASSPHATRHRHPGARDASPPPGCCSARGLRADRRDKLLKWLDTGGQNCTPNNIVRVLSYGDSGNESAGRTSRGRTENGNVTDGGTDMIRRRSPHVPTLPTRRFSTTRRKSVACLNSPGCSG